MSGSTYYGPVLLPSYEELQALAELVAFAVRRRREYGVRLSPVERRVVEEVLTTAAEWRRRVAGGSDPGSDRVSDFDSLDTDLGAFTWLDVRDAASRLSISQRAVVAAVHRGALEARRHGRGRGRWQVTEKSLEAYESRRNHSNTDSKGERAA